MFSLKDKELAQSIVKKIQALQVNYRFMHVCGTHQDTLMKHGLDVLLKECGIYIGQGPGCPVCVTTPREIEEMMVLAKQGKIITSFGDMLQVPGKDASLQELKTQGHDVRTVYSIEDAVTIARQNPEKDVVFMAVGFETTAPSTAVTLQHNPPENFSVLCCHRLIPPALDALLAMGDVQLDGFIDPGHVSTIIGMKPYELLTEKYQIPQVIAGFEPIDILMSVWMLVQQLQKGQARVENEYTRAVHKQGNVKAKDMLNSSFSIIDVKWRGFPVIPRSGYELHKKLSSHNARLMFEDNLASLDHESFDEPPGCRCGDVLRGVISSEECPLFGTQCVPSSPVGPCMVSVEGSCNIEYRYKTNK